MTCLSEVLYTQVTQKEPRSLGNNLCPPGECFFSYLILNHISIGHKDQRYPNTSESTIPFWVCLVVMSWTLTGHVYESAMVPRTQCHSLGDLNTRDSLFHSSGGQETEINVSARWVSSEAYSLD